MERKEKINKFNYINFHLNRVECVIFSYTLYNVQEIIIPVRKMFVFFQRKKDKYLGEVHQEKAL